MSDSKSVKMHYDVAGDDFDRAGEASAGLKRLLQKIGVPADIIRRIAIGTYEAEMNVQKKIFLQVSGEVLWLHPLVKKC